MKYGGPRPLRPSSFHRNFLPSRDRSGINRPEADVFDLQVLIQTFGSTLAADARLFDAAKRHDLVGEDALVNSDHAGVELLGDAPSPAQILAEQIGGKPERRVVGKPDRIRLGVEA